MERIIKKTFICNPITQRKQLLVNNLSSFSKSFCMHTYLYIHKKNTLKIGIILSIKLYILLFSINYSVNISHHQIFFKK